MNLNNSLNLTELIERGKTDGAYLEAEIAWHKMEPEYLGLNNETAPNYQFQQETPFLLQ